MAIKSQFTQVDRNSGGSTTPKKQKGSDPNKNKGVEIKKDANGKMIAPPEAWAFRERSAGAPVNTWGARVTTTQPTNSNVPGLGNQSAYVPVSPGMGTGGAPNARGVPGMTLNNTSMNPGLGLGGDIGQGGAALYGVTNGDQRTGMTGAGADFGYTPQGLGMLYDNPNLLASDVLEALGIKNPGMSAMLGDAFMPALYAYTMLNPNLSTAEDAQTIDYIANYMQQMTTPGGALPTYDQLMDALMGVGRAGSSDLSKVFAGLTPQEQTEFIAQYAQAAGYTLNPLMQRVLGKVYDYDAQQYLGGVAKGDPAASSYARYLQQQGITSPGR